MNDKNYGTVTKINFSLPVSWFALESIPLMHVHFVIDDIECGDLQVAWLLSSSWCSSYKREKERNKSENEQPSMKIIYVLGWEKKGSNKKCFITQMGRAHMYTRGKCTRPQDSSTSFLFSFFFIFNVNDANSTQREEKIEWEEISLLFNILVQFQQCAAAAAAAAKYNRLKI